MTALEDHPALVERRQDNDVLPGRAPQHPPEKRTVSPTSLPSPTLSCGPQHIELEVTGDEGSKCQVGEEVEEVMEVENVEMVEEEEMEEMEVVVVYERAEVLGAISRWLMLVGDRSRAPWSDTEAEERWAVLGQTEPPLDPFHQFDWSHCWTHRDRAMTVLSGARNSQGRRSIFLLLVKVGKNVNNGS